MSQEHCARIKFLRLRILVGIWFPTQTTCNEDVILSSALMPELSSMPVKTIKVEEYLLILRIYSSEMLFDLTVGNKVAARFIVFGF